MAMAAGLVTQLADVDLENCDAGGMQGMEARLFKLFVKGRAGGCLGEHLELPACRGQGAGTGR